MFCFLYSSRFAKSTAHPGNRTDRKGAGLLGPTKADWGQTWPSFALSWSYMAQLGHVPTQVGLNMRNLVLCGSICRRSWAQDRPTFYRVENARPPPAEAVPDWQIGHLYFSLATTPPRPRRLRCGRISFWFHVRSICSDFAICFAFTSVLDRCWGMDVSLLRTRSASLSAAVPSWEPSMSLPGIWWWCPCTVSHLLRFTGFFRAFHREDVFVLTTWEDPRERQENIMRTWEDMDSYDIGWFVYEFLAVSIGVFLCLVILASMWARSGRPCGRLSPGGDFFRVFRVHFLTISEVSQRKNASTTVVDTVNHCLMNSVPHWTDWTA